MTSIPKPDDETQDVMSVLMEIPNPKRRADAIRLHHIMEAASGFKGKMWGRICGYGAYHYKYDSGREGDAPATGFHAQKAKLSLYIMPGYQDLSEPLSRLGQHKRGAACLYINKLADVDEDVLAEIIKAGLNGLGEKYAVTPE